MTGLLRNGLRLGRPLAWCVLVVGMLTAAVLTVIGVPATFALEVFTLAAGMAALLAVGNAMAVPISALYRRVERDRLQGVLSRLDRQDLARVLLPLRHVDYPDTRRIVDPLVRALRPEGTEVLPAGSPGGGEFELATEGNDLSDPIPVPDTTRALQHDGT